MPFVKVVIEKVDDRNAETIMKHRNSGSICDKITSHRRPSDLLGQLFKKKKKKKKKKKMEKFRNFRTGLSRYYWGYF